MLKQGHKAGSDRFTLIRELGRGGMGGVWLAPETSLVEPVALESVPVTSVDSSFRR